MVAMKASRATAVTIARPSLLVGLRPRAARLARRKESHSLAVAQVQLQEIKLEQMRIAAEQRNMDRELELLKIDERRRAREDRERRRGVQSEDEATDAQLEEIMVRAKARREKKESAEATEESVETTSTVTSPEVAPQDDSRRQMLTELAAQLLSGQWKPPERA